MAAPAEKEEINYIHKNAILTETVHKENRTQKLYVNYSVNPFKKIHTLTEKPNSPQDEGAEADYHFLKVIKRANVEPTKKYVRPQTESQEVGWISRPLIETDRSDGRLYFPKNSCEITKFMDAYWKTKPKMEDAPKAAA